MPKASDFFKDEALVLGQAIEQGDMDAVATICDGMDDDAINAQHKEGMTFLHFAFVQQNEKMLAALVKGGASTTIDVDGIGSVLRIAVMAEDTRFLAALLEAGVDPNTLDSNEMPYFFQAAFKDEMGALELFVKHDVDLNLQSSTGRTAALHAFTALQYDQVEYLIKQGIDLTLTTVTGLSLAEAVETSLGMQAADTSTAAYKKLVELRQMMMERGVTFPASTSGN